MGDGYPGIGRRRNGGRYPRDYFIWDVVRGQKFRFLAPAPENKRVAPFEPDHRLALPGLLDQQPVDFILLQDVPVRGLAGVNAL